MLTHWVDSTQSWAESQEVLQLTSWIPQPIYFEAQGDTLYILCNDVATIHYVEQFFIKSTDGGLTWSEQLFLSDIDNKHSQRGAMAIDDQRIFATWFDYKYGSHGGTNGDILGKLSTDGGETWSDEIRLTYNQMGHVSSPVVFGNRLNIIWEDLRYRQAPDHMVELSHRYSYDDGATWSPTELITPSLTSSIVPYAEIDWNSGDIRLLYIESLGDENALLYTTGSDFTGVEDENSPHLPESPAILTNYPNPFNTSTIIRYQLADDSDVRLSIYNLLGEKVTDLVNDRIQAGEHKITWDASPYSSGIYFCHLKTGKGSFIKRMVLLK